MALLLAIAIQAKEKTLYEIDFSTATGNVKEWLEQHGWKPEAAILKMNPRFENGALVLETPSDYSGAFICEFGNDVDLSEAKRIEIDWSVGQYPAGADWSGEVEAKRNTREAIAVIISFGKDTFKSGHLLAKELPFFIGLFPCATSQKGQVYVGNFWQEGGRYVCVSGNGTTDPLKTRYELPNNFERIFGTQAPAITGLAIEVDAKNTEAQNGYHTRAFIRKISILADEMNQPQNCCSTKQQPDESADKAL